ncbi:MAG: imidazole glycerol phosphate synthase subunit HisH [Deltaproteobacteria bacterium]|nr:imidazole glycerol phosphate synthase subunit HisH [Deltaproteobacteria bacterium]
MIVIIDYDMGNVGSIANMIAKVGGQSVISNDHGAIKNAAKLILPGVGAFDTGMENIAKFGLLDLLNRKVVEERAPLLGICLGMQLLGNSSEEGVLPGLGWIDAKTIKFPHTTPEGEKLRIPHMGWNYAVAKKEDKLFSEMYEQPRFYFVHSYHVVCSDDADVLTESEYGIRFHSALSRGNIWGTQFHPEKSHKYGMKLIYNFVHKI